MIRTAEFVSPMHPDKICDTIVDTLLDEYLKQDPNARVALEAMAGHGSLTVSGEVTSTAKVDPKVIVLHLVPAGFEIIEHVVQQSPEIARGVDTGGAGDQGIMVGYATAETPSLMPFEYERARELCQKVFEKYPYDGKTQVTAENGKVRTVVVSFQNASSADLLQLVRSIIQAEEYLINPAGEWHIGGFDADSGLSGRKLVVDAYGPRVPVGGGSFSGKDYTKVDRSGAYMARYVACQYLKKTGAKHVMVQIAYAIGKAEPVMARVLLDGKEETVTGFDLRPRSIAEQLDLNRPIYAGLSQWGHFGRGFKWDM